MAGERCPNCHKSADHFRREYFNEKGEKIYGGAGMFLCLNPKCCLSVNEEKIFPVVKVSLDYHPANSKQKPLYDQELYLPQSKSKKKYYKEKPNPGAKEITDTWNLKPKKCST